MILRSTYTKVYLLVGYLLSLLSCGQLLSVSINEALKYRENYWGNLDTTYWEMRSPPLSAMLNSIPSFKQT